MDALLYERIEKPTYDHEMARVGTALEALKAEFPEAVTLEQEVSRLLDFAEWMLERVAGIWNSANVKNKKRHHESLAIPSFSISSYSVGRLTPNSTAAEVIFPL